MLKFYGTTTQLPREFSIFEICFLLDAAQFADDTYNQKVEVAEANKEYQNIGNINATRQALFRSVFISFFAVFEQYLDVFVNTAKKDLGLTSSPKDLNSTGIKRSIEYAKKELNKDVDTKPKCWQTMFLLQKVRNHLVHYGHDFDTEEHNKIIKICKSSSYVSLNPAICFSIKQLESIGELLGDCAASFEYA